MTRLRSGSGGTVAAGAAPTEAAEDGAGTFFRLVTSLEAVQLFTTTRRRENVGSPEVVPLMGAGE